MECNVCLGSVNFLLLVCDDTCFIYEISFIRALYGQYCFEVFTGIVCYVDDSYFREDKTTVLT